MEDEDELRELPGPSSRADDDPEVTQFYVNPIAKPIPHGRLQTNLQDTISELNMHKAARNGLEVCVCLSLCVCVCVCACLSILVGTAT